MNLQESKAECVTCLAIRLVKAGEGTSYAGRSQAEWEQRLSLMPDTDLQLLQRHLAAFEETHHE